MHSCKCSGTERVGKRTRNCINLQHLSKVYVELMPQMHRPKKCLRTQAKSIEQALTSPVEVSIVERPAHVP